MEKHNLEFWGPRWSRAAVEFLAALDEFETSVGLALTDREQTTLDEVGGIAERLKQGGWLTPEQDEARRAGETES